MNQVQLEEYLAENPEMIPKRVSLTMKKTNWLTMERPGVKSKMIVNLSNSNKALGRTLGLWMSEENCLKDEEQLNSVKELMAEVENLDKHLRTEKGFLSDLKNQIHQAEQEILRKKEASRKRFVHPSYMQNADRCQESNKIKLHAISVQLSDEQTKNVELKEKIRVLMTERKLFNKEFNGLLEKLEEGKKHMKMLDTSVNHALHHRENMQNKLNILHDRETKQKAAQEDEMRDLNMRLENESIYKRFFAKKNKVRQLLPSVAKDIDKRRKSDMEKISLYHDTYEDVKKLSEEYIEKSEIKCADLVNVIKIRDGKNMSLFNFANKQYDELQALREKVLELERNFEEKLEEREEKIDRHEWQKDRMEAMRNELEERKLGNFDDIRTRMRVLEKLFSGIDQLVKITKADISAISLLLGENNQSTQFNYTLFLQAVESRIMELLGVTNIQPKEPTPLVQLKTTERTKTLQSKSCDLEIRAVVTRPCIMCYPVKRETVFVNV